MILENTDSGSFEDRVVAAMKLKVPLLGGGEWLPHWLVRICDGLLPKIKLSCKKGCSGVARKSRGGKVSKDSEVLAAELKVSVVDLPETQFNMCSQLDPKRSSCLVLCCDFSPMSLLIVPIFLNMSVLDHNSNFNESLVKKP